MKTDPPPLEPLVARINDALGSYADESWHYSRLRLAIRPLDQIPGAKALWLETIATDNRNGQRLLRDLRGRVSSAVGHLSELPLIQIVICRINDALLALTTDEDWQHQRPFVTWAKKSELAGRGLTTAVWYEVEEHLGDDEEFD
ncbi:MAG: hypothetical protein HZA91_06850 [Verrucomicrobia bacterium]|nr:hypothetical protein [Verrucomicrobiota bacterium]